MERTEAEARALFARRMQDAGIDGRVIEVFLSLYDRYRRGETGKVPWAEVGQPAPGDIVPWAEIAGHPELVERGRRLLGRLAVIRLNGGLGTTMKLDRAKSLIAVRGGQSFLELTVRQVLALRRQCGLSIPWLAMDSFRTREDTLQALARFPALAVPGLPLDFLQNMVPRIERATGQPASLSDEGENWAPPGHGDIYLALSVSGVLQKLIDAGIRWAFVSNVDNLGATVDLSLLGYLEERGADFAIEVTDKTRADVKGGTLIRRDGRLTLLERAQVAPDHLGDFEDIQVFSVFNTNNLWWRLEALAKRLWWSPLDLPLIVNPKKVGEVEVLQLETAMGAAVGWFDNALGIRVPRERFAPVKATCDLLAVRSDAYLLGDDGAIRPSPARDGRLGPPVVVLDDRYYKGLGEFEARFPHPLSLLHCRRLSVEGDLWFGRDVRLEGEVTLRAAGEGPRRVPDGTILSSGTHRF